MEIELKQVVFHQHDLKKGTIIYSDIETSYDEDSDDTEKKYLVDLITTNSKKNVGKLAVYSERDGKNKFRDYCNEILKDENKFVSISKKVMQDLILTFTPQNSTAGNYLFCIYNEKGDEAFINDSGETSIVEVDETKIAVMKFEYNDSHYIEYKKLPDGRTKSQIVVINEKGLPDEDKKVKKAIFHNNYTSNILNYEFRIIDKESPGVAKFFSEKIVDCNFIIRPQHYIVNLKNETQTYLDNLVDRDIISREIEKDIILNFNDLIQLDNTIDQSNMGQILLSKYIDNEDELDNYNDELLERYHSKGLTYNKFKVEQRDLDQFHQKRYIHFSKDGYLKFSKRDESEGLVDLDGGFDKRVNKYIVKLYLKDDPTILIKNK